MGNRISTEVLSKHPFNVNSFESTIPNSVPDASVAVMNCLRKLHEGYVIDYESSGKVPTQLSGVNVSVTGSNPNYIYSFSLSVSVLARFGKLTVGYTVVLTHVETLDELNTRVNVPVVPSSFDGSTQQDAFDARDTFFTDNPSRLVDQIVVTIRYGNDFATSEDYRYALSTTSWVLVTD